MSTFYIGVDFNDYYAEVCTTFKEANTMPYVIKVNIPKGKQHPTRLKADAEVTLK